MTSEFFYVYVLQSESTGRRYVGQTSDLHRRLLEHNSDYKDKYTSRQKGPWKLVYSEKCSSRRDAIAREKWLKSGIGRAWLLKKIGRARPPESADGG